jgi:cytoskeletal protein CcmA (bactofilin family)
MRFRLPGGGDTDATDGLPAPDGAPTLIAAGLKVRGILGGNVDVIIDGAVEGEVSARTIAVGVGAGVDGSMKAHVIDIAGAVRGRVEAMTVNIAPTARVNAAIYHFRLNVEEGASVKGLRPWRPAPDMEGRRDGWGVSPR